MAITLAEAKVGMADKVDQQVVDEFRRSSLLLDRLVFDNAISPGTGGSTLTYGYVQLKTPSTAAVRAINAEYTAGEAKREEKTAKAVIMGGSFELDRVIQNTSGAVDELAFQAQQKIKATSNYFHNLVVNGSSASSGAGYVTNTFDGLRKLLNGTSNELSTDIDLSDASKLDSNSNAFIDQLDALVHAVDGDVTMLLMNADMLLKVRAAARRAGYYERTKDDFGRVVELFGGIPLMDCGKYYKLTAGNDIDKMLEEADKIDKELRDAIDYAFDYPCSDIVFGAGYSFTTHKGVSAVEQFLSGAIGIVQKEMNAEAKAAQKRQDKYLAKYKNE